MNYLFCTAVLLSILGWTNANSAQNLSPQATGVCTTPGQIICSADCKTVIFCTRDITAWLQKTVENCPASSYCDAKEATCHTYLTNCSPTVTPAYQFPCTTTGFYPDPYDCTVYHDCTGVGLNSVPTKCEEGWAFDALTGRCDLLPSHWVCRDGPVPQCVEGGQAGPVQQNPNIYYVCRKDTAGLVRPDFYKCAGNGVFDSVECT